MKLIIGLGNAEKKYDNTRHNIGFRVLDEFVANKGTTFKAKDRFKATIAEYNSGDDKVILAKPLTFYNLSGEAARALADFYSIPPEDILIIHDDLALTFGTIRTREQGSDAGNNGIKSITEHVGPATKRIRIGTNNEHTAYMDAADFVLAKFTTDEKKKLPEIIKNAHRLIDGFLSNSFESTTL